MPNRLPSYQTPLDSLCVAVRELKARPTAARVARYPGAMVLLPVAARSINWSRVPFGAVLEPLYARKVRKAGDWFAIRVGESAATLLIVAAVGDSSSTFERLQSAAKWARAALEDEPAELLLYAPQGGAESAALLACVAALQAAAFRLPEFKSKREAHRRLKQIDLAAAGRLSGLDAAMAAAAGGNLARWLTALPPNRLDSAGYRLELRRIARRLKLGFKFYGEAELKRLGAGAFLAVSQGNPRRDAGIVRLSYRPRGAAAPQLALVGKGICFDTGGTNLKPHEGMLEMHADMAGSAAALGTLYALHAQNSPLAVDCWLAITENLIGPNAYKPQDLVRALNGTTIQVIHTDAEGRMVLADALSLAATKKPRAIIDYATLTGACIRALTERYSGAFTNRPEARDAIEAAGRASGERVWCFPMDADYDADLASKVADLIQCTVNGRGDHILAARFLNRFVPPDIAWLHLDLSSAMREGGLAHVGTDITGFGVRYALELISRGWPPPQAKA